MKIFSSTYQHIKKISSTFTTTLDNKNYISTVTNFLKNNSNTNSKNKRIAINGLIDDLQEYIEVTIYKSILERTEENKGHVENNVFHEPTSIEEKLDEKVENISIDTLEDLKINHEIRDFEIANIDSNANEQFLENEIVYNNSIISQTSTYNDKIDKNAIFLYNNNINTYNSTKSLTHNYNNHLIPFFFQLINQSFPIDNSSLNKIMISSNNKPFHTNSNQKHLILKSLSIALLIYQHCNEQELMNILFFVFLVSFNEEYRKVGQAVCEQIILGIIQENKRCFENEYDNIQKITPENNYYLNTFSFLNNVLTIIHNVPNTFILRIFSNIILLSPYKFTINHFNLFFDLKNMDKLQFHSFKLLIEMNKKGYSSHIDIDYLLFYYNQNEEIILKVLLNNHIQNDSTDNIHSELDEKNGTYLNDQFIKDKSQIIQLLPICLKNMKSKNDSLQLLRYRFLLRLALIYKLKILNYIESFLENYNDEYKEIVKEILGIMINEALMDSTSMKNKQFTNKGIDFHALNKQINDLNQVAEQIECSNKCVNDENFREKEPETKTSIKKDRGNDSHIYDFFSIDDIAPILKFTVSKFPTFIVSLISNLHLYHLWPIVTNNLSESDLLNLFTSQKIDLESLIIYNEKYVKEMYFTLREEINKKNQILIEHNYKKSDYFIKIILSKLPLNNSFDVLIDVFQYDCDEKVIIDYLISIDLDEKNAQNYHQMLNIIFSLLSIKPFKQVSSLDSLFVILNHHDQFNQTNNLIKYEVFLLLSKYEHSMRLVKSIVKLIKSNENEDDKVHEMDNLSLSLKSLELIRSIETNEINEYLDVVTDIIIQRSKNIHILYEIDILNTTISLLFDTIQNRVINDTKIKEIIETLIFEVQKILIGTTIEHIKTKHTVEETLREYSEYYNYTILSSDYLKNTHSYTVSKDNRIDQYILSIIRNIINLLLSKHTLRMDIPFYCFLIKLYHFFYFIRRNDIILVFLKEYKYDKYIRFLLIKELMNNIELIDKRILNVLIDIIGDNNEQVLKIDGEKIDEFYINEILKHISNFRLYLINGKYSKNSDLGDDSLNQNTNEVSEVKTENSMEQSQFAMNFSDQKNEGLFHADSIVKEDLYQLILKVCASLPCENVLPFYLRWLPNIEINRIISDGSRFTTESLRKILEIKINWEDKIELLKNIKIRKEILDNFVNISKIIITDGYRAVNEYFDDTETNFETDSNYSCEDVNSSEFIDVNEKTSKIKSTLSTVQKEGILIDYIKKYMSVINEYKHVDSSTIDIIFNCCEMRRRCVNLSLFCYDIALDEYKKYIIDRLKRKNKEHNKNFLDNSDKFSAQMIHKKKYKSKNIHANQKLNKIENNSVQKLFENRISNAIQSFILDTIKYEQLSDKCKRDEVIYILKVADELISFEKSLIDGNVHVSDNMFVREFLAKQCIELLKIRDFGIIEYVHIVLKKIFN